MRVMRMRMVLLGLCSCMLGCSDESAGDGSRELESAGLMDRADGWADQHEDGRATTGGASADAAHRYWVSTRSELVRALFPDAEIARDGTFTSAAGADPTPKIIVVRGALDLSVDGENHPLSAEMWREPGYDFAAYVEAFKPSVWNIDPANWNATSKKPNRVSGALEAAREASARRQAAVVVVPLAANTTIMGLGHAKLRHGSLLVGEGVDNVVIRNLTFEDAFDHFPAWDPSDSFVIDAKKPGCQDTYQDAGVGPHRCPGGRWNSAYDNVQIAGGTHVWVDHCSFSDAEREDADYPSVLDEPHRGYDYLVQHHDGAVDVTLASDFVTISYNHFTNHDKTLLLGSSDTATAANGFGALSVTVHHNHFDGAGQRLPRVRFGTVHVYNNYYTGTLGYLGQYAPTDDTPVPHQRFLYGIGIGYLAKIYAENNVFEIEGSELAAVSDSVMFFNWYKAAPETGDGLDVGQKTYLHAVGTVLNGEARDLFAIANAAAEQAGKPALGDTVEVWEPSDAYAYTADAANTVKSRVLSSAGAR